MATQADTAAVIAAEAAVKAATRSEATGADIQRSLGRVESDVRAILITIAETAHRHEERLNSHDVRLRVLEWKTAWHTGVMATVAATLSLGGAYIGWLFRPH